MRHAAATRVDIQLSHEAGRLTLSIKDDGVGFDVGRVRQGRGMKTLRSRAEEAGAEFKLNSQPGGGTVMRIQVPAGLRNGWFTRCERV